MGSTTENSYYQKTHNPYDLERVPGGSSGGSAAAVSAGEAMFTLGSDTGGSIRQPASFCGVTGLKPTYGAISRFGLIAFASSLDQIGPIARTAEDIACVLPTLMGHDSKDSTSAVFDVEDYLAQLNQDVRGMKIAIPEAYFGDGLNDEVRKVVLEAAETFKAMGAKVEHVSMTNVAYALPAYYLISSAEASSNLARFDGVQYGYRHEEFETLEELYMKSRSYGFGKEVKRRILLGTYALSSGYYDAYYKKALQARTLIKRDFDKVFEQYDLVLTPVAPTTAYKIGEKSSDPLEMYMGDIYTVPVNIVGLPAISLNAGFDQQGLPVGMQLIGKTFSEATLLRAADAYEKAIKGGQK
jgi:aspartyl-tRNA(Asn)/glutamyl-tRNA(Gln) amidotransferase subunit A